MDELKTTGALIVTEVIKNLAKDMASFISTKVKGYYVSITNTEQVDSGWVFIDYLQHVRRTFSGCKTYLYKDEARDLLFLFEPTDLYLPKTNYAKTGIGDTDNKGDSGKNRISSRNIRNLLNERPRLLITGVVGMSKTLLLKFLCIKAIDEGFKVPVFVSLRWFNDMDIDSEPLEKLIYERLSVHGFKLDYDYFRYSLEGDKYVFLFDGFDEVSFEKRATLTHRIADFTKRYYDNYFVISSRPIEEIFCFDDYKILSLCEMTPYQATQLIWNLEFNYMSKKRFIDELEKVFFEKYLTLVTNPLLLSIMFDEYVQNKTILSTLKDFYEKYFKTTLYIKDWWKEGYKRTLKSDLNNSRFREVLQLFCFKTYFQNEHNFSDMKLESRISETCAQIGVVCDAHAYIADLVNVTGMLVARGDNYEFIHPNVQEYFAACYVSNKDRPNDDKAKRCSKILKKINHNKLNVFGFFDMLFAIDPDKFESVILLPIYNKIWETFLTCSKNYYKTITKYLMQEQVHSIDMNRVTDERWAVADTSMISMNAEISVGEVMALIHYGKELESYRILAKSENFNGQINACFLNIYQDLELECGIRESFLIREVGHPYFYGFEDLYSACKDIITFFIFALNRREYLLPKHNEEQEIARIIDDF